MLESNVSVQPTGSNVLVKVVTTLSPFSIMEEKLSKEDRETRGVFTIAGAGQDVRFDFKLDQRCHVSGVPSVTVEVPENEKSMKALSAQFKLLSPEEWREVTKTKNRIDVVEYAIYYESQIVAVVK